MKLLQDCWLALLELLDLAAFSTSGRSSLQEALQQPDHQQSLPGYSPHGPRFTPPNRPENRDLIIKCEYPSLGAEWTNCSTPEDRACWLKKSTGEKFDIHTDYEYDYPEGITRKYDLVVSNTTLNADGLVMPHAKLFNNKYPGPWIQACWGDIIEVTVHNKLKYNGTSIHWHGLRQLNSLEMDGVNAVTQCPISPDDSFTYKFRVMQYGTSWYHSHYSLQYGDGMAGPLTIYGPSSANYDTAIDPILMTDWNHRSGFEDFQKELTGNPLPVMDSILLNGNGSYAGGGNSGHKYRTTFEKGKKYLLRLINTSVDTTFVFAIDNHNLTVITSDFVPIHNYTTDHVVVGIGQRYHVIVTALPKETSGANSTANDFWIRTVPATGCSRFQTGGIPDQRQGIIHYGDQPVQLPTTLPSDYTLNCGDEPYDKLVPIREWTVGPASNARTGSNGAFGDNFGIGTEFTKRPLPTDNFSHWAIGKDPLFLNFSNPTILSLDNTTFNPEYVVIPEDYNETDWVYLLIDGLAQAVDKGRRQDIPAAHPIHLHGHDFALLLQSSQNITANPPSLDKLKLNNPPRRDVVLLPGGGYVIIAFKADNPGAWLLHCHIAWHASSGLALQILERPLTALKQLTPDRMAEPNRVCDRWHTWFKNETNLWHHNATVFQDDSGI
ncbi:hypothetical protein MMC07_009558 [Pseudocyphellaria aurata]|nr:hypothetical protein [Pseudocyphellaria aurata]